MLRIIAIVSLLALVGCKTVFPNFPNVFYFQSHQDLLDQAESIDTWKDKK